MHDPLQSTDKERIRLTSLDPIAFQHPLDRQAITQLKRLSGFDTFVAKFIELGIERLDKVLNIASSVRVSPRQLPKLYGMLRECCAVLDVAEPELYVSQGGVNAFTTGHNHPYIVLQTGLIDLMDDDEVMAVIAHEVGHIKCGHVLYKVMARELGGMIQLAGDLTFGIGKTFGTLLGAGLQVALWTWDRRSEYTADRASLLVLQDPRPCISMLMKLAGGTSRMHAELSVEEFLSQARAYGEDMDRNTSDRFYRLAASLYKGTHPFAIERAKALNDWVDSPEFDQILSGSYARLPLPVLNGCCARCGRQVMPGYQFCAGCGHPLTLD